MEKEICKVSQMNLKPAVLSPKCGECEKPLEVRTVEGKRIAKCCGMVYEIGYKTPGQMDVINRERVRG